jgi:hypothetical protein
VKKPAKAQERETRSEADRQLDEEIEESFPASDPPSTSPTTAGGPELTSKPPRGRKSPEKWRRR